MLLSNLSCVLNCLPGPPVLIKLPVHGWNMAQSEIDGLDACLQYLSVTGIDCVKITSKVCLIFLESIDDSLQC
uniref:DUF4283 domain-containing protein n=1 Tax=Heterorhabditis bacteriophora TaxID=37862 RepID=A0A1I7XTN3_HETBA